MPRIREAVIAGLIVVATMGVSVGAAQAQDYPPTTPAPNGVSCTVTFSSPDALLPNATVTVTLACTAVVGGRTYTGALNSTPVVLPATVAQGNGAVTFSGVKLPADWEVNATHTATLVDQATGGTLGKDDFYVNTAGKITAAPSSNLPKTGNDLVDPALRGGAVLLAAGAVALLVARRRRDAVAAV